MNLLPQIKEGFDAIMADKDIIASNITANMTFFKSKNLRYTQINQN